MAFKRMEGFAGSVPQKFIDHRVPACPMCKTDDPHWAIDQKMGWLTRYLFQCEKCGCILSATVADVTGMGRTPLTTMGLAKMLGGKKANTIYMKVDQVGFIQATQSYKDSEMSLEELNDLANQY